MRESTLIRIVAWLLILGPMVAKSYGFEISEARTDVAFLAAVSLLCTGWILRALDK